jgi:hypothetical protein
MKPDNRENSMSQLDFFNEALDADLVGITSTTSSAPRAYEIADILMARDIPVVMGGCMLQ